MNLESLLHNKNLVRQIFFCLGLLQLLFLPFLFQPDTTLQEYHLVFLTVIINVFLLLLLLMGNDNRECRLSLIDFAICLWILYSLISVFAVDALYLNKLILFISIYVLAKRVVSLGYDRLIFYTVIVAGLLQSVLGVLQLAKVCMSNHSAFASTGSFANPGPFGGYIGVTLAVSIGMLFYSNSQRKTIKVYLFISTLILASTCIISDSRAAWMGIIIVIINIVLQKYLLIKRKYWLVGIAVFLLVTLFLFYFYRPISADARILIWKVCCMMVQEHPMLGGGIGTFPSTYMYYQADYLQQIPNDTLLLTAGDNIYPFNEYMKVLCEQGMIGLILFLFILFAAFRSLTCIENENNKKIMLCPLIAYLTFSFFSYPSDVLPLYLFFPLFLGGLSGYDDKTLCKIAINKWIKRFWLFLLVFVIGWMYRDWLFKREVKQQLTSYLFKNDKKSALFLKNNFPDYRMCVELVLQYSDALYLKGEYADAIRPLKQVMALSPSSQVACDLGDCYQRIGNYVEAESYFSLASRMVPGLITPKYLLFLMYLDIRQDQKAQKLAREIIAMPLKQVSERTENIKIEVSAYLKSLE